MWAHFSPIFLFLGNFFLFFCFSSRGGLLWLRLRLNSLPYIWEMKISVRLTWWYTSVILALERWRLGGIRCLRPVFTTKWISGGRAPFLDSGAGRLKTEKSSEASGCSFQVTLDITNLISSQRFEPGYRVKVTGQISEIIIHSSTYLFTRPQWVPVCIKSMNLLFCCLCSLINLHCISSLLSLHWRFFFLTV